MTGIDDVSGVGTESGAPAIRSEVSPAMGNAGLELGVHLFEGFFTKFGSPGGALGGEKPREFMNRQLGTAESKELAALRAWTRREAPPTERRLSAARPKPPAKKRGRKAAIAGALREQLCLLLSLGYSRRRAAKALGIAHTTVSESAKRDAGLAESLHRAETLGRQRRA